MKKTVAILFAFLPMVIFGQIFPEVSDYASKNIKEIKRIGYYSKLKKSGWVTMTTFSDNSLPYNKANYYKGELRSNYYFSYFENDSISKTIRIDSLARPDDAYKSVIIYYDKFKNLQKTEKFFSKEEEFPDVIEKNIVRDTENKIVSFTRRVPSSEFELTYNSKGQVSSIIETCAGKTCSKVYTFKYDINGKISHLIVDHNDPELVLSGVRTYSEHRTDKYHYKYEYDKYGNWIKRYSVTEKGKYLNAKRKIVYK